jgi:hypothetical protein
MEKRYSTILSMMFIALFLLTGCADNRDDTKESVEQVNQSILDAQAEQEKAWQDFKIETELKINANQKIIDDFKIAMKTTSQKFKATYANRVLTLEQQNIELKKRMNEYQYVGNENWEEFKSGISDDIAVVEKELKEIFEKNN